MNESSLLPFVLVNVIGLGRKAVFAGVMLMLCMATAPADQTDLSDGTAPVPADPPSLPIVLNDFDVAQYKRLFELQRLGRMKQAIREMGRLENSILVGHLLSQRYLHPTAWRSSYKELYRWLAAYNDHPDASRIFWLAKKRRPKGSKAPTAPKAGYLNGYGMVSGSGFRPRIPASNAGRSSPKTTRRVAWEVRRSIRRGWPSGALEVVNNKRNRRYLTKAEEGQLRGEIAHAYFIFGLDDKAIRQARAAIGVGRDEAAMGYWSAGLASWRSGQIDLSGQYFRTLAELPDAYANLRSAAGFWAYRVEMRQGRPASALKYLEIAAAELNSFYGVLARQVLGQTYPISFDQPPRDENLVRWLAERPGGQRIFALMQIGRFHDAERELRYLWKEMPDRMRQATLRFAMDNGMAGFTYRAGELLRRDSGKTWYSALYPIPRIDVEFEIDEALIWAISRQESGFNPRAKSRAKAAGLMQIMPATASFITRNKIYRGSGRHLLLDPVTNVQIGQSYITHLLDESLIENSIIKLLAAYNGGPGNLRKWMRKVDHQDDPLLLIESIPARETRYYVKNVITNLAMYRAQLGQPALSLDDLAAGGNGRFIVARSIAAAANAGVTVLKRN